MINKILVAAAITLSLGTAALADSSDGTAAGAGETVDQSKLPGAWSGDIGNAFYSDPNAMTLRSEDEIRTNWGSLTSEQQDQVRADCKNIGTTDTIRGSGNATGTSTNTATTTTDTMSSTSSGSSASGTMPTDKAHSLSQVCTWIDGM